MTAILRCQIIITIISGFDCRFAVYHACRSSDCSISYTTMSSITDRLRRHYDLLIQRYFRLSTKGKAAIWAFVCLQWILLIVFIVVTPKRMFEGQQPPSLSLHLQLILIPHRPCCLGE